MTEIIDVHAKLEKMAEISGISELELRGKFLEACRNWKEIVTFTDLRPEDAKRYALSVTWSYAQRIFERGNTIQDFKIIINGEIYDEM